MEKKTAEMDRRQRELFEIDGYVQTALKNVGIKTYKFSWDLKNLTNYLIKKNDLLLRDLLAKPDIYRNLKENITCPENYSLSKNNDLCYYYIRGNARDRNYLITMSKERAVSMCNMFSNGTLPYRKFFN